MEATFDSLPEFNNWLELNLPKLQSLKLIRIGVGHSTMSVIIEYKLIGGEQK